MPTTYSSLRVSGAVAVGGALTVIGGLIGASFSAPAGSNTVINAPTGKDIVYTLAGTEVERVTTVACTATGGNVKIGGGAKYNTCVIPSPLTTTGALRDVSIQCGNVSVALAGDLSYMKTAVGGTGAALPNGSNVSLGTGAHIYFGSGRTLWNPADSLKFGTLITPTGTLSSARYDCVMRAKIEDIYGR